VASLNDSRLTVALDVPLPYELKAGRGTALFVAGTCFHRDAVIRALEFVIDGRPQPVAYHRMPRLDLFRSLHPWLNAFATEGVEEDRASPADPGLHSYRSGFWGIVEVAPSPAATRELSLRATLENGETAARPLVTMSVPGAPEPVPAPREPSAAPLVAIGMATYQPPLALFRRQIESIREQTHRNWVCVISDDGSNPQRLDEMRAVLGEDPRFVLSPSPRRLGFYLNFERALEMVPA
jgi:glycosyl transferase family 2